MSALDIPPPPRPWQASRPVQIARAMDAEAMRRTLRPRLLRRTTASLLRAFARAVRP